MRLNILLFMVPNFLFEYIKEAKRANNICKQHIRAAKAPVLSQKINVGTICHFSVPFLFAGRGIVRLAILIVE
ncbi:MAG: hypothetical protein ACI9D5_002657 [Candidatus Endobugula sp.]|jgi:hypothetical protein